MPANRSVNFTGIEFENPFLLSSAPPTESESNILRAFEAGWGGVVTKTIGLHPVANVVGVAPAIGGSAVLMLAFGLFAFFRKSELRAL